MDNSSSSSTPNQSSIGAILKQLTMLMKNSAVGSAASYFLTITLASHFGPIWFGEYSYILIWGTIACVLINFETNKTAPTLFAVEKNYSAVLESVLSARILIFIVIFFICLFGAFFNFILAFGVICLSLTALNFSFLYEIKLRNVSYSYIYLLERLTYVSLVFSLIYLNKANLFLIYVSFSFSALLSICYQTYQNREMLKTTKLHLMSAWIVIKNNILLIFITLSTYVYGGFSRLILEDKFDMEMLGIFSAGWHVLIVATLFQTQVTKIWRIKLTTTLVEKDKKEFYNNIKSYLFFATVPVMLLASTIYLYTPELIILLYGPSYNILNSIFPILCFYLILINLDSLSSILWVAIGNRKTYLFINISATIILLIILQFFSSGFSLRDFTLVIFLTHTISVVLQYLWFYNKYLRNYF